MRLSSRGRLGRVDRSRRHRQVDDRAIARARLRQPSVDLDAQASKYYEEVGQPLSAFQSEIALQGYPAAARWWQRARAHAAARILEDHPGKVISFGAGHSHFEDRSHFHVVQKALLGATVIFLVPCADPVRSLELLRERSIATKGHGWTRDGFDYLAEWIDSAQNRELATVVAEVGDLSPQAAADHVFALIRSASSAL